LNIKLENKKINKRRKRLKMATETKATTSNPSTGRTNVKRKKAIRKSARAGVLFPVGRLHRYLKRINPKRRVSMGASVYTAAVMEYLAAEVLELSGNAARDNHRSRVTPRHVFLAVAIDEELKKLLKNVIISQGGNLPNIHPFLIKNKTGKVDLDETSMKKSDTNINTNEKAKQAILEQPQTNNESNKSIEQVTNNGTDNNKQHEEPQEEANATKEQETSREVVIEETKKQTKSTTVTIKGKKLKK
jgi:histone H2A